MLAELIDPFSQLEERIFRIANRRPGPQPHHALMATIAMFIVMETGGGRKIESAKEDATNVFSVSMSTVDRAWAEHKEVPDSVMLRIMRIMGNAGRTIN